MHTAILHALARGIVFEATCGDWIRHSYASLWRPIDLEILGWDISVFREELNSPPLPEVVAVIFRSVSKRIPASAIDYFRPASISFSLRFLSRESQMQLAKVFQEYYP